MQVDKLIAALAAVQAAILIGRLDALPGLTDTISATEPYLHAASPAQLRIIKDMAARNALCLQSAVKGVRAAQRRLAELHAARSGHATYDQHGQRAALGETLGNLRQRI